MSITPWYTVWCDGDDCMQWHEHGGRTRKEAWDNAKKIGGWKLVKGRHLCPDCQAAARSAPAEEGEAGR